MATPTDIAPYLTLVVVALALAMFVWERFPPEVVALSAVAVLLGTGVLDAAEASQALANPAPVTIACMFILSGALVRVGALDAVSAWLTARARARPALAIAGFALFTVAASAFMNNTPLVVLMIPVAIKLAPVLGVGASKLLMPLSYTAILGGVCTMIGTSTNLLVDGVARQSGMAAFSLFEITGVGLAVTAVGLGYMAAFGPRLLPDRRALSETLGERKALKFMSEVAIRDASPLIGRDVLSVEPFKRDGLRVIDVLRGDASLRSDLAAVRLEAGDRVVLHAGAQELLELRQMRDVRGLDRLSERDAVTVEALITPGCRMIGRSLGKLRLRRRYGVYPLAAHRRDSRIAMKLEDVVLRVGDTLLLEGDPEDIARMAEDLELVELARPRVRPYRRDRAPIALGAMAGVVALAAVNAAPIASLAVIAVAVVLLTRCVDADEAFSTIDGRLLTMILAMLCVGAALEKTGAVRLIAEALAPILMGWPPMLVLWGLILATSALTEVVTNNAVAVVMTPVAIAMAEALQIDARPLVVGVMIAASASFATPIGYQTNTLVYAAGGYRFMDFVRFGAPLNLLVGATAALVIPLFWSF